MPADGPVRYAGHEQPVLFGAQVHQLFVIAGLEIDVVRLQQAVIEDTVETVGIGQRRDRPGIAVAEEGGQLGFVDHDQIAMRVLAQKVEVEPVGGGYDGEQIAAPVLEHHALGEVVARDVGELCRVHAGGGARVRQGVVTDAMGIEVLAYRWGHGHGSLLPRARTCHPDIRR